MVIVAWFGREHLKNRNLSAERMGAIAIAPTDSITPIVSDADGWGWKIAWVAISQQFP